MKKTHIIIGSSAAGISAINKLRQLDAHAEIICVTAQAELPYNKCLLADYLGGVKAESQIGIATAEQLQQKNITLFLNTRLAGILPDQKRITLSDGQTIAYDTLLLALGTSASVPPIAGAQNLAGVFTFYTLADANAIKAWVAAKPVRTAVVIGAGLSGLEAADALSAQGIAVAVVERGEQVLANQVNAGGAAEIERCMHEAGVAWYPNQVVKEILGTEFVTGVQLAGSTQLPADLVIIATGARVNLTLLESAGIVTTKQGVLVDQQLMTNSPGIYAAGDLVVVPDQLTGKLVPSCTWPDAMQQGAVAAQAMVGNQVIYPGVAVITSSAFFGVKFVTCGPISDTASYERFEVIINQGPGFYHCFLLDQTKLRGYLLVGNTNKAAKFRRALLTGEAVDKESLTEVN